MGRPVKNKPESYYWDYDYAEWYDSENFTEYDEYDDMDTDQLKQEICNLDDEVYDLQCKINLLEYGRVIKESEKTDCDDIDDADELREITYELRDKINDLENEIYFTEEREKKSHLTTKEFKNPIKFRNLMIKRFRVKFYFKNDKYHISDFTWDDVRYLSINNIRFDELVPPEYEVIGLENLAKRKFPMFWEFYSQNKNWLYKITPHMGLHKLIYVALKSQRKYKKFA